MCSLHLQPLLDQLGVGDLSECTVTVDSMEEEEEEKEEETMLDLSQPSQSFFGRHIMVDISCE